MRKKIFLFVILIVVIVGVGIPLANLLLGMPVNNVLTSISKDYKAPEAAALLEEKCIMCHSEDPALPFYASLPLAEQLIHHDITEGTRAFDMQEGLAPEDGGPPNEAALAKIEHSLSYDTMPPIQYLLMHWNGEISAEQQKLLKDWIYAVRRRHYSHKEEGDLAAAAIKPIPASLPLDAAKVALGEKLYHDKRLSGDGSLSCASCHDLKKGGTDQLRTSIGINDSVGPINAPTTFNSGFQIAQFWDGRAGTLQQQAGGPVENPIEMGATFKQVVAKLQEDPELVAEFEANFSDGISKDSITAAIAEYERSLITPNSRFDRFLRGDTFALTSNEKQGWALFQEHACSTCHTGESLGGKSYELLGVHDDYFAERKVRLKRNVDQADNGRYNVTKRDRDLHRFKVPMLRNIEVTQPYFHDGSVETLDQAVKLMLRFQSESDLSAIEQQQIVAFLKTLTGEYRGVPLNNM